LRVNSLISCLSKCFNIFTCAFLNWSLG